MTKDAGGKLRMGPPWDFDLAFGNFWRDDWSYTGWAILYQSEDNYLKPNWMWYLMNDEKFLTEFRARWDEISPTLVNTLLSEIDRYAADVAPSASENFKKWKILGIKCGFQPNRMVNYNTFAKQIDFLKTYIVNRAAWISENIPTVVPAEEIPAEEVSAEETANE